MIDYTQFDNIIEDEFGLTVRKVIKAWQRIIQKCLDEFALTASQMEIMSAIIILKKEGKEVTQIALSVETNIDPMTTSTILRNLQKKGLITRRESEADTRARSVELTQEGADLFLKAVCKIKELYCKLSLEKEFEKKEAEKKLNLLYERINQLNEQL